MGPKGHLKKGVIKRHNEGNNHSKKAAGQIGPTCMIRNGRYHDSLKNNWKKCPNIKTTL